MKFRHLVIPATLLIMAGLVWATPDMRPSKQLDAIPSDTTAMDQAGLDGCHMASMHSEMNMHQNMQQMLEQMSQIQQTGDPAAREELMQQHMATMEQMMRMMLDMREMQHGTQMSHMESQEMTNHMHMMTPHAGMDHDAESSPKP